MDADIIQALCMQIRHEKQASFSTLLAPHRQIFQDRVVLDLGCHTGVSSRMIKDMGARLVIGVDQDAGAIDLARRHLSIPGLEFLVHDLEQIHELQCLVDMSQIVVTFGTLYHLCRHHDFMNTVCSAGVEYLIVDSLYGPESINTQVWSHFESNFFDRSSIIPKYVPNLAWLTAQSATLGFGLDYVQRYFTTTDFDAVTDHNANMRMTARFFNQQMFSNRDTLPIEQAWQWHDDRLIQQT